MNYMNQGANTQRLIAIWQLTTHARNTPPAACRLHQPQRVSVGSPPIREPSGFTHRFTAIWQLTIHASPHRPLNDGISRIALASVRHRYMDLALTHNGSSLSGSRRLTHHSTGQTHTGRTSAHDLSAPHIKPLPSREPILNHHLLIGKLTRLSPSRLHPFPNRNHKADDMIFR